MVKVQFTLVLVSMYLFQSKLLLMQSSSSRLVPLMELDVVLILMQLLHKGNPQSGHPSTLGWIHLIETYVFLLITIISSKTTTFNTSIHLSHNQIITHTLTQIFSKYFWPFQGWTALHANKATALLGSKQKWLLPDFVKAKCFSFQTWAWYEWYDFDFYFRPFLIKNF